MANSWPERRLPMTPGRLIGWASAFILGGVAFAVCCGALLFVVALVKGFM